MEENQSEAKKEYEIKKQERLKKRKSEGLDLKRKNTLKGFIKWFLWIVIIALIGLWTFSGIRAKIPKGEDFSQSFPSAGRDHIEIGSEVHLPEKTYSSNPPSSGPHFPNTAKGDFYEEALPDQYMIHNLEHGDIWIAYHPRVPDEVKRDLKKLAGRYVIVTPREKNGSDISLVAWGKVDSFNLDGEDLPTQRIKDFILRYDDQGPEKVRGGGGHQATNFN